MMLTFPYNNYMGIDSGGAPPVKIKVLLSTAVKTEFSLSLLV